MAASIVTTATSLEGQVLETVGKLQLAEEAYNVLNPNETVNRVSISPNIETGEISLTINLPITSTVVAGSITSTAATYL